MGVDGGDLIKQAYFFYVFGKTSIGNSVHVDPDQTLQTVPSDQGLHCLPLIKHFYTHSQVVKWTCLEV